jgi:hypothetical protein
VGHESRGRIIQSELAEAKKRLARAKMLMEKVKTRRLDARAAEELLYLATAAFENLMRARQLLDESRSKLH